MCNAAPMCTNISGSCMIQTIFHRTISIGRQSYVSKAARKKLNLSRFCGHILYPFFKGYIPVQIIVEAKHFARKFNSLPVERSCVMPLTADIHPHNQSRFCHLHYFAILSIIHLEPPVRCGYYHLLGCNLSLPRGSFYFNSQFLRITGMLTKMDNQI